MNAKLSIWSFYYYDLSPEDTVKEFKKHGIFCSELSSEHGGQLLSRGEPEQIGRQFREFLNDEGFTITQGHLSLGLQLCKPGHADELLKWLRLYDAIGIENAVLHLTGFMDEDISDDEKYSRNLERLHYLEDNMKGLKIRICLENLTKFARSVDELMAVVNQLDPDRFGICLDTGHLNMNDGDQTRFILTAGDRLHALHIADNEGERDQHMMPFGKGNVDFAAVVKALREIDYHGMFNYEIPGENRIPFEVRGYKLEYIKRAYEYLMRE